MSEPWRANQCHCATVFPSVNRLNRLGDASKLASRSPQSPVSHASGERSEADA
jgi:hypothetical protein